MDKHRLIHIIASNRWSGVERYALDLCRHFHTVGWDVTALTRDAKAVDNKFADAGIPLIHAPLSGFFDISSVQTLVRLLKRERRDGVRTVIHVHRYRDALRAIGARRLSGRKDVKIVMTYHICAPGRDNLLYNKIYAALDAILFVSDKARETFLSTWADNGHHFAAEDKLSTVHNSLYLENIGKLPEPDKGPIVAMYHGRLAPGKGLETLIRALSLLAKRTLRLRITGAGNPDYVDSLRDLAQSLGVMDSIDWRKHVDDPLPVIAETHFGLMPSEDPEAFGLSNLEYMACGRPVICSSNGGPAEYLTNRVNALIVEPGDVEGLADAMRYLARNPAERERMGENACQTFMSDLSWDSFVNRMSAIYDFNT